MVNQSIIVSFIVMDSKPSRANPNLAKLMRVMKKHDLTSKKTKTKTNTFREHLQRAIFETFDL